jgi:sterol desaturase/sphingolipid hydroxylase (fatty acid hydroxylase superfamily)
MDPHALKLFAPAAIVPLVFLDRAVRRRTARRGTPDETGVNFLLGGITLFSDGITVGAFTLFYQALAPHVAVVHIPSLLLQFAIAVVLGDFLSYVHHRCMHAWPVLWASHIVHHQSRTIDLSTGLRNHPFAMVGTCLAWGLLLPLGIRPEVMLGAAALIGTYDVLVHRSSERPGGRNSRWLGLVLNLPEHHRVHHSADAAFYNSNYALLFIVWDRLLGTYRAPQPAMASFGVEGVPATGRVRTLLWAEWMRLLGRRRTWADDGGAETDSRLSVGLAVYLGAVAALALMALLLGFPPV